MRQETFILLDIEGTTTSIDFVHKVLFPYASQAMAAFVRGHSDDPLVRPLLEEAIALARSEGMASVSEESIAAVLSDWIAADRKITCLKALQGLIWEQGYQAGSYRSHLYDDVAPAFARWSRAGIRLGIYSSGSIAAQKLLFAHTEHGDLTSYLCAYFDTTSGGKKEISSYQRIASQIQTPPSRILFLSDVPAELAAAKAAGLAVCQVLRPGTAWDPEFPSIHSFSELDLSPL